MKCKSLLALLLALALCLGLTACGGSSNPGENGQENQSEGSDTPDPPEETEETFPAAPIGTSLGSGIADLTFTDYNGVSHSLYETLKEKKMVLINIWATWCGPCQAEFPYLEMAYEEYQDDIEIFALSCEAEDTDEIIADFAASFGLTFPMGQDTPDLGGVYALDGIPTSLIIDRFGSICFLETGSITSAETFCTLFDIFVTDDYPESVILPDGAPKKLPDVAPADPADLSAVLGEGLTCSNPDDEYNWPMIVEDDHIVSTNAGVGDSVSSVNVEVTAAAGDVLAVDYAVSSEASYDFATIYVNDELVKYASGARGWTSFAYQFEAAGTYTVTLAYEKDEASDDGSDTASFKNVRVLSGSDADALLASMPSYPHAEESSLTVTTAGARQVLINDPTGTLEASFGSAEWYIIPGDSASFSATLAEGLDAEGASFYSYYDGSSPVLSDCISGDHYEFVSGIDNYETTGSGYCYVELVPSLMDSPIDVFFFNDEANLNAFLARNFTDDDGTVVATWRYAEGSAPETTAVSEADGLDVLEDGNSLYYLVFTDQNGDPVEGIMANVCDDSSCTPMQTDANGIAAFSYPAFAYHIQVIKVPDGYDYDLTAETYVSADGGVTEFTVTKN